MSRLGSIEDLSLADVALFDFFEAVAKWQNCIAVDFKLDALLVAGATDYPAPLRNFAIRRSPSIPANHFLDRATQFFFSRGRAFSLICRKTDGDLVRDLPMRGATYLGGSCRMVCTKKMYRGCQAILHTEKLINERHISDLVEVNEQSLSYPPGEVRESFSILSAVISSLVSVQIVYSGNMPVTSALAVRSGKTAFIDWVGTIPASRRKGYGKNCMSALCNDCFEKGYSALFLNATQEGHTLYKSLGFKEFGKLEIYLLTPPL